jgi:hypothetical protein
VCWVKTRTGLDLHWLQAQPKIRVISVLMHRFSSNGHNAFGERVALHVLLLGCSTSLTMHVWPLRPSTLVQRLDAGRRNCWQRQFSAHRAASVLTKVVFCMPPIYWTWGIPLITSERLVVRCASIGCVPIRSGRCAQVPPAIIQSFCEVIIECVTNGIAL